jgi:hypothetical protein
MKKAILIIFCSMSIVFQAQLKVGKQPKVIQSNTYLQVESDVSEAFVVTKDSAKVGIGTASPTNKLHVKDAISNNPLRIEGLLSGSTSNDSVLMINSLGVVRRNSASALASTNEPWYSKTTSKGALLNTDTIYQMGYVGIGTTSPVGLLSNHSTNMLASNGQGVVGNNFSWSSVLGGTIATIWNTGTQTNATTLLIGSAGTTTNNLLEVSTGTAGALPTKNIFSIKGNANIGVHKYIPTQQFQIGNSGNVTANKTYNGSTDEGLSLVHYINTSADNSNNFSRVADIVVASPTSASAGAGVLRFLTSTNAEAGGNIVEKMRIHSNGFLGIGTTSPITTLTVENRGITGSAAGAQAIFRDTGTGNAIIGLQTKGVRSGWFGLDRSSSTMYWNNDGTGGGNALSNARMVLTSTGNFGLGTTTPGGALTLYGANSLALPSTIQGVANSSKEIVFAKGGVTTGLAAITAVDNGTFGGGLSFLTKASNSMDNFPTSAIQAMVIDWNGRVGIGTGSPICALHVEPTATALYNLPNRQFISGLNFSASSAFGNVGNVGAQTQSLQVAAYFGNRIQVNGFIESQAGALTLSDLRAKNIIGITNNEKDLNTLSKIQITDYKLKDIHLGQNEQKKVIAQQLDTVYPQAVITQNTPKLMPTVYDYPKEVVIEGNNIRLVLHKANEYIKKGEKLVLRFKDKEYHVNVLSIQNNEIGLDKNEELIKRNDIKDLFIYGTFVNDAKSVDYEAISMLNVSATQALLKKVNNLETENNDLKKSIDFLLKEVQALKKIKK